MSAVTQHDDYELNPICFYLLVSTPTSYSSLQNGQSQPLLVCDTYFITYFMHTLDFICKKNQQLMCMLCIESYICISVCKLFCFYFFFPHYRLLILYVKLASVSFTGLGPSLSDRIEFNAAARCRTCSCRWPGCGRLRRRNKCQRSTF